MCARSAGHTIAPESRHGLGCRRPDDVHRTLLEALIHDGGCGCRKHAKCDSDGPHQQGPPIGVVLGSGACRCVPHWGSIPSPRSRTARWLVRISPQYMFHVCSLLSSSLLLTEQEPRHGTTLLVHPCALASWVMEGVDWMSRDVRSGSENVAMRNSAYLEHQNRVYLTVSVWPAVLCRARALEEIDCSVGSHRVDNVHDKSGSVEGCVSSLPTSIQQ